MYKMLVLDMDGTLLNEEQSISKTNKEAIKKAIEAGIKVVLASGRHYNGLVPYINELGLNKKGCYVVTCSGAVVRENVENTIVYEKHIGQEHIPVLQKFCDDYELDICGYGKDALLIHHDNLFSRYDSIANKSPLEQVDFYQLPEDKIVFKFNLINESDENAGEIINYFPADKLEDESVRHKNSFNPTLLGELWRFPQVIRENYNIVQPLPFIVEIFDKASNKATGVKIIADLCGIKMSEVIAMGDSGNDVHMLEEAGLGVAMENAREETKQVADEITLSNLDHGVAHIINKYLL